MPEQSRLRPADTKRSAAKLCWRNWRSPAEGVARRWWYSTTLVHSRQAAVAIRVKQRFSARILLHGNAGFRSGGVRRSRAEEPQNLPYTIFDRGCEGMCQGSSGEVCFVDRVIAAGAVVGAGGAGDRARRA